MAASSTISITIRDVPTDVRDELAARAARAGQSLQEFMLSTLRDIAGTPELNVVLAEIRTRARTFPRVTNADILDALDADRR